jgi:prolyl oligopeptidase
LQTDLYEVKQVWYPSKDGTKIPMFLAHARGLKLDGSHPTLLTGYGGFNLSSNPSFNAFAAAWIASGGVWALANLRGGGEFGEAWHHAGMKENKQNVFDDFIAAAEWLVQTKYTSPQRLAIRGRSNGGLLMGAAITQRPDLFAAVSCGYPLSPDSGSRSTVRQRNPTSSSTSTPTRPTSMSRPEPNIRPSCSLPATRIRV